MHFDDHGNLITMVDQIKGTDRFRYSYVPFEIVKWVRKKLLAGATYKECMMHPRQSVTVEEINYIHLSLGTKEIHDASEIGND